MIRPVVTFRAGNDPFTGAAGAIATLDLTSDAAAANIAFIQGVFLDLADVTSSSAVSLIVDETQHRIKAKGATQGWYPLMVGNTMKFTLVAAAGMIGQSMPLLMTNVQVYAAQWATA